MSPASGEMVYYFDFGTPQRVAQYEFGAGSSRAGLDAAWSLSGSNALGAGATFEMMDSTFGSYSSASPDSFVTSVLSSECPYGYVAPVANTTDLSKHPAQSGGHSVKQNMMQTRAASATASDPFPC